MTSPAAGRFSPVRPAGVVGYAMTTYSEETRRPVIGFDMGGTSTDVSRFGGEYELVFETETARRAHPGTAASDQDRGGGGGGSRLFFDNGMFRVGPESAGAHPGPVCYRKNGRLAITDANLVLGRIQPDHFPHIFGPTENQPLDLDAARRAMQAMADTINTFYGHTDKDAMTIEQVAMGFIQVANETMVRPIREISVMRGFDIEEHILATFGGAGAQHACAIARNLGISKIFIHRFSGILSAYGIGMANVVAERRQPASVIYKKDTHGGLMERLDALQAEAEAELRSQGFAADRISTVRYLNLRYNGTDTAMMIPEPVDGDFEAAFKSAYRREFGFDLVGREIRVDDLRVRAQGKTGDARKISIERADGPAGAVDRKPCYFEEGWLETAIYHMADLKAGHTVDGPAIILQDTATIVVEPDCRATVSGFGDIEIQVGESQASRIGIQVDPVQLSIFSNLFMSIAEQMGRMLQKTAISTNIKERLDFSCALFGPEGSLVANAPHLPVHLGSMGAAVKEQIRRQAGKQVSGDVLVSNHPAAGGSHLPDITVITPVFKDEEIIFWVASRGHHADIGGISPGSMPPNSRRIEEEGACITSFKLVENGVFQEDGISDLLLAPGRITPQPGRPTISGTRLLADNISDLKAQVAANRKGIELVLEMVDHYGLEVVQAYMGHVRDAAEAAVRGRLRELSLAKGMAEKDTVRAIDYLDDGSPIMLALTIDRATGNAHFDFTGTGPEIWGNCNAPAAVTRSAILYSLRCLIEKDLPLNDGCV